MAGFLRLGDDFGLFWPTLADGVSQWSRLQFVSLAGTCKVDVLAGCTVLRCSVTRGRPDLAR